MPHTHELTLIQINDSHAYFESHPELLWSGQGAKYAYAGGYARIATVLKSIRAEKQDAVLALDCGDTFHGTYAAVQTQGEALLPILKSLGLDAMTGHWDFAYGPEQLKKLVQALDYPMLAVNCYVEGTRQPFFEPYRLYEVNGLRIGVIGVAATIVDKVMPKHFSQGVCFTLGNEELPGTIHHLRHEEGAQLIVVISHLGFPQDMQLAHEVDGIDVLLSAHTHNRLFRPVIVNTTLVIQSGAHGAFLGRLDVQVEGGRITDFEHRLLPILEDIEPDAETQVLVNEALSPYRDKLNQVVGHTADALHRYTALEAPMDHFLLASLQSLTGAQVAFSNGWRYGAPIVPGPITLNDLHNIIPVNPPVEMVQLTGREIRTMLEENLEHTYSRNPYQQMGGFVKRCLGLALYFKMENPEGHRIQELFIGDRRVQDNATYSAAFVTTQGVPARYGRQRETLESSAIDAMLSYLEQHRRVTIDMSGTVVAI